MLLDHDGRPAVAIVLADGSVVTRRLEEVVVVDSERHKKMTAEEKK